MIDEQNIIKIFDIDKDKKYDRRFNLLEVEEKVLNTYYRDYKKKDIGSTNVFMTKNNNFYKHLFKCGFIPKSGPSGSIAAIIGFISCIFNEIDLTPDIFNTILLTCIIYLFVRNDHSLGEILLVTPVYGYFMMIDNIILTRKEIDSIWSSFNCPKLIDILSNITTKSSIKNSSLCLRINELLKERSEYINSISIKSKKVL
jgi:hypothetical protein